MPMTMAKVRGVSGKSNVLCCMAQYSVQVAPEMNPNVKFSTAEDYGCDLSVP